ncbi:MAG: hypothetical protein CYPHOPRED_005971 [Cyphobasidiales sp. Tagirdzhanova-0007]|nr:MAG: hypothetical protein CYPHOPRED_005971 [Cyphobasidiales sp. Tagirdzhanova-0007]
MDAKNKPLRVAIVGGGIAGLSLAAGILQEITKGANLELTVYEQAPKFAEIGAGVSLGPNALRALNALGLQKQLDRLNHCPEDTRDLWFEFRFAEASHPKCGEIVTRLMGRDSGSGHMHRADLLACLMTLLPVKYCRFNKRVTDYETYSTHACLKFADGTSEDTDLIVACDGVKSPLRKVLYRKLAVDAAKQQEKYAEWIAWRGGSFDFGVMSTKYPQMLIGLDRHILTFPVKGGAMMNLVGFVRDPDRKKINGQTAPWQEERPHEEMLQDFDGFSGPVRKLIKAIPKPSIWGIFDLPPLPISIGHRIVLTGDAKHATTPHQGAGAGQATEDALFLARLLGHSNINQNQTEQKIKAMLAIFQNVRHERSKSIQITSAEAGLLYEGRGTQGEGQETEKVKGNLDGRMEWIWEYDTEGALQAMLRQAANL